MSVSFFGEALDQCMDPTEKEGQNGDLLGPLAQMAAKQQAHGK
ncbi:MAG: hypothetical protein O2806_02290 [Bacteroidetes bacterium]|nr:hypothetical protein [Bacteroidota bacterium]